MSCYKCCPILWALCIFYSLVLCSKLVMVWIRNVPHMLRYLNTWSPVGDGICGGLVALLEEKHRWGRLGQFIASPHFQFSFPALCLWWEMWSLSFPLLLPAAITPPHPNMGSLSGNLSQINFFVMIIVFDIGFLSWQQKSNQYKVFTTERKTGLEPLSDR